MARTSKTKGPTDRYTTVAGEVYEYPRPSKEVRQFLKRVRDAANDPRLSAPELAELVYGSDNPLLDQTVFAHRGAVRLETWDEPAWRVMLDILDRKREQAGVAPGGLTVAEAAEELDVTQDAIRKAIRAGTLAADKRGGAWYIERASVASYRDRVVRRGPTRAAPPASLEIRRGSVRGASFRVKAPSAEETGREGQLVDVVVPTYEQVAVCFSGKNAEGEKFNRMFILEPAPDQDTAEYAHGPFYVRGRFRIAKKINHPRKASEAFRSFEPR